MVFACTSALLVGVGRSSNEKLLYLVARIVPLTSSSYAGFAVLIPTFCVSSLTINEGLLSEPTWRDGSTVGLPLSNNLIPSIPEAGTPDLPAVDVILLLKLTGPLNSEGKLRLDPPPTRRVFLI